MKKINLVRRSIKPINDKLISYMLELEVISAEDIDKNIFVKQRFRKPDGTFDDRFAAVASPTQLEDLDVNSPREGSSYFRTYKIQLVDSSLVHLDYLYDTIVTDISLLVEDAEAMTILEDEENLSITPYMVTATSSISPAVQSSGEYRAISIDNPTQGDNLTMFYTTNLITIGSIMSLVNGSSSPSVTWTLRWGANRSSVGTEVKLNGITTTDSTFGQLLNTFDNPTIPGGSFLWIEITGKSGAVNSLDITVIFG